MSHTEDDGHGAIPDGGRGVLDRLGVERRRDLYQARSSFRGAHVPRDFAACDGDMVIEVSKVPATDATASGRFGRLVLRNLLHPHVQPGDTHQLLVALGSAVEARDVSATAQLWQKLERDALFASRTTPSATWARYAVEAKWPCCDYELVSFLALRVRRPTLLIAFMAVDEGQPRASGYVVGVIAAVLSDCFVVSRLMGDFAGDLRSDDERWASRARECATDVPTLKSDWMRALGVLYLFGTGFVSNAQFKLHCAWSDAGTTRTCTTSLLDVAVLASERSAAPTIAALQCGNWTKSCVLRAFRYALVPGALRGDTFVEVAAALYRVMVSEAAQSTILRVRRCAWRCVYSNASWWTEVETCGLLKQARMQTATVEDAQCPMNFEILVRRMCALDSESGVDQENADKALRHVLRCALNPCSVEKTKPALLLELLRISKRAGRLEEVAGAGCGARVLKRAALKHREIYSSVLSIFCDEGALRPEHWHGGLLALESVARAGAREPFMLLLNALAASDAARLRRKLTTPVLRCFVEKLCSVSNELLVNQLVVDFGTLLNLGEWTEADLQMALVAASSVKSGVAIQVLISPPHNAKLLDGDALVRAVFDAVFAPGEPLVRSVGARWGKRGREV
jgi:hypothetical protein